MVLPSHVYFIQGGFLDVARSLLASRTCSRNVWHDVLMINPFLKVLIKTLNFHFKHRYLLIGWTTQRYESCCCCIWFIHSIKSLTFHEQHYGKHTQWWRYFRHHIIPYNSVFQCVLFLSNRWIFWDTCCQVVAMAFQLISRQMISYPRWLLSSR